MSVQQLRKIFALESEETLQHMEDALLQLEKEPTDKEAINTLFRSAHTIKGSSGIVGLDAISAFTHTLENVLDRVRNGDLAMDLALIQLLLACHDHVRNWTNLSIDNPDVQDAALQANTVTLQERLREYLRETPKPAPAPVEPTPPPATPKTQDSLPSLPEQDKEEAQASKVTVLQEQLVEDTNWHISLRFAEDALCNGIEPLAIVRYLEERGRIVSLSTLLDTMPAAVEMNPESCYLGFEIAFKTEADKESVESMLDLVRDYCKVQILPPHSLLSRYIDLIQALPENTMRLGDILLKSGTLTPHELQAGLHLQNTQLLPANAPSDTQAQRRIGEILVEQGAVPQVLVDAALDKQKQVRDTKIHIQQTLQVDAEKLDQLINLVGELVIANASVRLLSQQNDSERLNDSIATMSRLVEDIRNSSLRMRMVHIGNTFNRFRRMVHDISRELGKSIDLVLEGSETELDKSMVEKINDPLMHLVRNAIDHGIEAAQLRVSLGKAPQGTLHLNAYHDSGNIVIEVSDDGRGLDRDKILNKALEKGLITADQELTERDIDRLIFEPGISTATAVTELSGRGVGLDVVKRNISELNGSVEVDSLRGEGTRIRIYLPLTLAIIDGFLFCSGNAAFVVPLDRVIECVEVSRNGLSEHEGYLNLRGRVLPLLYLDRLFSLGQDTNPEAATRRQNIIVVRHGEQQAGLVVNSLQGEFQAVIKPLGKILEHLHGVSGATILGSGEVALILDVPALIQKYAKLDFESSRHPPVATPKLI